MKNNQNSIFTDAILLALASLFTYLVAFNYEYGYCLNLNIPIEFISITWTRLFIVAISLFGIAILVLGFINIIEMLFNVNQSILYAIIYKRYPVIALALVFFFVRGKNLTLIELLATMGIGGIIILGDVVFPLITQRNLVGGYNKKYYAQQKLESEVTNIGARITSILGINISNYLIVILCIMGSSFFMGSEELNTKQKYLITEDGSQIVLRVYGERYLFAKCDVEKGLIYNNYKLIKVDDYSKPLMYKKIGKLKVYNK